MNRHYQIHLYIITSIIVAAVSYFMVDRVSLRAAQLANNDMTTEYSSRSIIYTVVITLAYSALYWIFVRDISKGDVPGGEG